jgi:hypothetical protein
MQIANELANFLASPVMIIIGTSDARGQSEIARGAGAKVDADRGVVELVFSGWQWPATIENLRANPRIAVTFACPTNYVSYQVKGRATLRDAGAQDINMSERYLADIANVLIGLGMTRELMAPWLANREAAVAQIHVDEIYVQTPGTGAGQKLGARP